MNADHLDLNLLRVFDAVMREGSITGAGARLALSQPATSSALRRLREQCDDLLFVRTGAGMKPTPFALALQPTVQEALAAIKGALERHGRFDPRTSVRTFNLLMTDVGVLMFAPALIRHLQRVAPHIRIACRQTERERYAQALASGAADLAVGEVPAGQPDLVQQKLFDEQWVCMVGPGHPTVRKTLTLKQFLSTPQIATVSPGLSEARLLRALGAQTAQIRVVLEVQHYLTIPLVLAHNPLVAVVPQSVSRVLGAAAPGTRNFPLPFKLDPVRVHQLWHKRSQHDAGHRWLRAEIAKLRLL